MTQKIKRSFKKALIKMIRMQADRANARIMQYKTSGWWSSC